MKYLKAAGIQASLVRFRRILSIANSSGSGCKKVSARQFSWKDTIPGFGVESTRQFVTGSGTKNVFSKSTIYNKLVDAPVAVTSRTRTIQATKSRCSPLGSLRGEQWSLLAMHAGHLAPEQAGVHLQLGPNRHLRGFE